MGTWYSLPARKYGDDMAEINTRLHYKINGVTDEIKCYTTLTEVQNQGIPVKVGGVAGYAKYGPASDANASRGNYKPPGGTAQRILKQAQVPYGSQMYTSAGTFTFTVPAGVTKLRITARGGGGGGGCGDRGYNSIDYMTDSTGGAGGSGGSAKNRIINVSSGATYSITIGVGGNGGTHPNPADKGKTGGSTIFGTLLTVTGGGGGSAAIVGQDETVGARGANGTPSDDYAVLTPYGTGGAGGTSSKSNPMPPGSKGNGGAMKIEWGGSI